MFMEKNQLNRIKLAKVINPDLFLAPGPPGAPIQPFYYTSHEGTARQLMAKWKRQHEQMKTRARKFLNG